MVKFNPVLARFLSGLTVVDLYNLFFFCVGLKKKLQRTLVQVNFKKIVSNRNEKHAVLIFGIIISSCGVEQKSSNLTSFNELEHMVSVWEENSALCEGFPSKWVDVTTGDMMLFPCPSLLFWS